VNEFLASLKSDLLDRRMLPFLAALVLAVAGAVAYTVLGGSSSSTPVASNTLGPAAAPPGSGPALPVAEAPANPHSAVSETTEGARFQHRGGSHDPFKLLPGAGPAKEAAAASASAPSSSGGAESKTGSEPSSGSGAGSTPTPAPKPKVAHKLVPTVSVLFGLSPTTPEQLSQLTPYASVKQNEILPAASNPLIVFIGVSPSHKTAIFALTVNHEPILKGPASCLPSATQCELIELAVGQSEELSYLEPDGTVVAWELVLKGVTMHQVAVAHSARTAHTSRAARAGAALLRRMELPVLHDLHYDAARGVLRFVAPRRHRRH
jgi:hypothetical protein